jgi:hypothetical protein
MNIQAITDDATNCIALHGVYGMGTTLDDGGGGTHGGKRRRRLVLER